MREISRRIFAISRSDLLSTVTKIVLTQVVHLTINADLINFNLMEQQVNQL